MLSRGWCRRSRGQALVEFALVVPVFLALIGGIVQFGLVFWAQNTLTQVVRDTGRWEATQQTTCTPASSGAARADVVSKANSIAASSSLLGYSSAAQFVEYASPATPPEGVAVSWARNSAESPEQSCPPSTNLSVWVVTITVRHTVATFIPGMTYLPGLGTCDSNGCRLTLSSTAQYRMEPKP